MALRALATDRDLVHDLAQRGRDDDVRSLHGLPLVTVVSPSDVSDQSRLLNPEERCLLGRRLLALPGDRADAVFTTLHTTEVIELVADEEADQDELRVLATDLTGALKNAVRGATSRGHRLAIPGPAPVKTTPRFLAGQRPPMSGTAPQRQ